MSRVASDTQSIALCIVSYSMLYSACAGNIGYSVNQTYVSLMHQLAAICVLR